MALSKVGKNQVDQSASLTVDSDLTVDTNTLYVDSTNNRVGVGTTSPVRDFVVQSPSGQAADLSIRTGDTTSSAVIHFGDSDADNQGQIVYQNSDDSMVFNTSTGLGIKLTSSGNVGIGITSP